MTLDTRHDEKKNIEKEYYQKLNRQVTIFIILIGCLGAATATLIAIIYGSSALMTQQFSPQLTAPLLSRDLGSVSGFVTNSDSLPVDGASIDAYKNMGLANSADKNAGYSTAVTTESDGSFVLSDLPSGVYKFTVTHPNGDTQSIDNYAVWPSSGSSYIFVVK